MMAHSGINHIIILVDNLDAAAEQWTKHGFTLSERGVHSDFLGTANHTVMFDNGYIELMGIVNKTSFNEQKRKRLEKYEGLASIALNVGDPSILKERIADEFGFDGGVFNFSRPIRMSDPNGPAAKFTIVRWPDTVRPLGLEIFACKHLTPAEVWRPELLVHRNGAYHIDRLSIKSAAAEYDASFWGELIGGHVLAKEAGCSDIYITGPHKTMDVDIKIANNNDDNKDANDSTNLNCSGDNFLTVKLEITAHNSISIGNESHNNTFDLNNISISLNRA